MTTTGICGNTKSSFPLLLEYVCVCVCPVDSVVCVHLLRTTLLGGTTPLGDHGAIGRANRGHTGGGMHSGFLLFVFLFSRLPPAVHAFLFCRLCTPWNVGRGRVLSPHANERISGAKTFRRVCTPGTLKSAPLRGQRQEPNAAEEVAKEAVFLHAHQTGCR